MFRSRAGKNNICGANVRRLRIAMEGSPSQRAFAKKLQLAGIDMDNYAIRRIENGERFVTDIELVDLANFFNVDINELLRH